MAMATPDTSFRLGIDFGTSHTTAILRWPDGHARPLLFDGSPLLPSAVYAEPDGRLLVGRDAIHAARIDPARFEPTPKRRIDQATVRLGDQDVSVVAMVAAVLGRVRDEAVRVSGTQPHNLDLTLTHPAGWDATRKQILTDACRRAGLPDPRMVPEPVAAAGYFVAVLGRTIPAGSALVVYDFGGGTFDASVVSPAQAGYEVLAVAGLDDVGGVDLDAALLEHVARAHHATDPDAWQRLEEPQTPADRRHRRHLVEDVRAAKEMLSRAASATVPVPLLELEARITREEFDTLARPLLDRTVDTTNDVIRSANLPTERVAAVLLVGGSSRIPLVADLLLRQTGLAPSTIDQPETVVAEGSVRLASGGTGTTRASSAVPVAPPVAPPVVPVVSPTSPPADPWARHEQPTPVLPAPTPRAALTVPVMPQTTAVAPPQQYGPYEQPAPHRSYQGTISRGRRRPRWLPVVLVIMAVAVVATGTAFGLPYLLGDGTPGATTPPTAGRTTPATPYVRQPTPVWLPAGWPKAVDDATDPGGSVVPGAAANGGTCEYEGPGILHVQRNAFDVSGCQTRPYVKAVTVRDGAVEAEFKVVKGCGGMWIRVSNVGYFVAVCADGTVRLHELANDPADAESLRGMWQPGFDPQKVVVGILAQGATLTIYIDGVGQQAFVDDSPIVSGRIGVGAFAPSDINAADVTINGFRAWAVPEPE